VEMSLLDLLSLFVPHGRQTVHDPPGDICLMKIDTVP
jgi:hypothetical protein